jgi:hypothetical protein
MPNGGHATIETANVVLDAASVQKPIVPEQLAQKVRETGDASIRRAARSSIG